MAEYSDEAVSAYSANRGPGLADAMAHASELAREQGECELWVQHSDRLARGDGRLARHAVEIALWALRTNVRVRSVQAPDTFRDLLYAVVTGQRNHEDSRRKSLAIRGGRRRAQLLGECCGKWPDGYHVAVEVDPGGGVRKHLELDPERRPLFEHRHHEGQPAMALLVLVEGMQPVRHRPATRLLRPVLLRFGALRGGSAFRLT